MQDDEKTPLTDILLERIRNGGPMTFAEFMAACLYEPGLGYYTSTGRKVGAEGDFYTSSNVHRVFGRLIAREICRMWETMSSPDVFTVVEVGAGNGRLARDIMDGIEELEPSLYPRITYRFIEAEPSLEEVQRQMLGPHASAAAWSSPADLAGGTVRFSGCLLSNELIDAFPVHVVENTAQGLKEVLVTAMKDRFGELLAEPSKPDLASYLKRFDVNLAVGQRAEINLAALGWLESVAAALTSGYILTIDYGYTARELYLPSRINGTLLCYYRHQVEEDPFLRPGRQDITSHVNFTALIEKGRELGLEEVWFGEQYRFLMAAGMMEEMMALETVAATEEERLKNRLALKKLILPDGGMGDTFRVLVQARGVAEPRLRCREKWDRAL